jgi:hypothetical protein
MISILELGPNDCIHTPTEKEAIKLLKIFDSLGLKWVSNKSYIHMNEWDIYRTRTVYIPILGKFCSIENIPSHFKIYDLYQIKEFSRIKMNLKYIIDGNIKS